MEAARTDRRVRGLDLARNYGQHNALLAGIRAARGGTIVTIDDDLQNPPEEIPRLLAKLDEGYDVVYGSAQERRHGILRGLATRLTKWSLKVAVGSDVAAQVSAFRVFRTRSARCVRRLPGPVRLDRRTAGLGNGALRRDPGATRSAGGRRVELRVRPARDARAERATGFTTRPLRFATLIGIAFTFLGFLVLVFVLIRYLIQGNPVPGFPFLASLIAIFSGAQLLTLGIIGEYVARMHLRVMDRPAYAVHEEVGEGARLDY